MTSTMMTLAGVAYDPNRAPDFGYVRVSGPAQSVERQHSDLAMDQRQHAWGDSMIILTDEGIGASILSSKKIRPDYEILVALIKSGQVDGKVIWLAEASRVSRNMEQFGHLRELTREHNVGFYIHGKRRVLWMNDQDDMGELTADITKAEAEVIVLSGRVKSGVRNSIAKKRPHGRVPFGYTRTYDPANPKNVTQSEHPVFGPVLREIFKRYAAGESTNAIVADLNRRAIPSPHDAGKLDRNPNHECTARWNASEISKRCTNPVYLGLRHYSGLQTEFIGFHDGDWPALVDQKTFNDCKARAHAHSALQRPRPGKHLVTGTATCAKCGGYVGTRVHHGRAVYTCNRLGCINLDETLVNEIVMEHMRAALAAGGWRSVLNVENEQAAHLLQQKLAKAREEHAALIKAYAAEQVSLEIVMAREPKLKAAITAAEVELDALAAPATMRWAIDAGDVLGDDGDALMLRFMELEHGARRAVLKSMLEIKLHPIGRGRGKVFHAGLVEVRYIH